MYNKMLQFIMSLFMVLGFLTLSISNATAQFDELYLVGDATPGGWDLEERTPLTQDDENPSIFTWSGELTEGEFKIQTYVGDWCDGDWIHPLEHEQPLDITDYQILEGCGDEDPKWVIEEGEAGEYSITVDLENETITFGLPTSIHSSDLPTDFQLNQNYPNPFNPSTTISYVLPQSAHVTLEVYNIAGQHISTLVDAQRGEGQHIVTFDGSQLSSGTYIYRLHVGEFVQVRKLTLIK